MDLIEHELVNSHGDRVRLLDYGARITSLQLNLPSGRRDVVLGYASPQQYLDDPWFMGCTTGRYSNRIRDARMSIGSKSYVLTANDGAHHLHGGAIGFDKRLWTIDSASNSQHIEFELLSEDGDQGYPGNLDARVSYAWGDDRTLRIGYSASTDRPTHVSLTNHAYFNLDPDRSDILAHTIRIDSARVTAVDDDQLPTGELLDVAGTALDLRSARTVGEFVESGQEMIHRANGADINYVVNGSAAAELWSSSKDLSLTVTTSYPGLQFYSGQQLDKPWYPYCGLCLEAQYFPDSPNQAGFPSSLLQPGRRFEAGIEFRFSETGV